MRQNEESSDDFVNLTNLVRGNRKGSDPGLSDGQGSLLGKIVMCAGFMSVKTGCSKLHISGMEAIYEDADSAAVDAYRDTLCG